MKRWLVAVVVALVLGVAALAEAECAWVLWSRAGSLDTPIDAFESREECREEKARLETMEKRVSISPGLSPYFFTCLPDTIDPRGPKR
jgi:hypothetical protein